MPSSSQGITWTNRSGGETLFGDGIADLPDPGCKGSVARWEAGKAIVASNVQDNGDPGGPEQDPRYNLTVSTSFDNGMSETSSDLLPPLLAPLLALLHQPNLQFE